MSSANEFFLANLVGTWSARETTGRNVATGEICYPMGDPIQGCLIYTPDGYMSSIIQTSALSNWKDNWTNPTEKEARATILGTQSYHGPFYVERTYPAWDGVKADDLGDGKTLLRRTIYHDIKTALMPNWRGTLQKRLATMELKDGKWHLTMRVRQELDLGALGKEGKWILEVKFVKAESNEPGKGLPPQREVVGLQVV